MVDKADNKLQHTKAEPCWAASCNRLRNCKFGHFDGAHRERYGKELLWRACCEGFVRRRQFSFQRCHRWHRPHFRRDITRFPCWLAGDAAKQLVITVRYAEVVAGRRPKLSRNELAMVGRKYHRDELGILALCVVQLLRYDEAFPLATQSFARFFFSFVAPLIGFGTYH